MIVRNVMDRRSGYFVALLLQEATAILLLLLSAFQFLTGLGWVSEEVASVVPRMLHFSSDQLLMLILVVHGMVGVRASLIRRKVKLPGGDVTLVAVALTLIAAVLLLI